MDKISQAKREEIIDKVAIFLEKNYPCSCEDNDPDCVGSIYEAEEVVDMVIKDLTKEV